MATWINKGPANEHEELVFEYLEKTLPEEDIFYSNHSISRNKDNSSEIDILLITSSGLYCIEIKRGDKPIQGNWQGYDGNPINQADGNSKVIRGKLQNWNEAMADISVKFLVCLTGERNPDLSNLYEDASRKRKVIWYKNLPNKLKQEQRDKIVAENRSRILEAIDTNFNRQYEWIENAFQIQGMAWKHELYTAYYAKGKTYPSKYLLKIYNIPKEYQPLDNQDRDAKKQRWQTLHEYTNKLNHELEAVKVAAGEGDQNTGGSKNVVIGEQAFLTKNNSQYVVVMQWVNGKTLSEVLASNTCLSDPVKYTIATQLCRGLSFAHSAGIIHRNLHPGNVIFDGKGQLQIINFDFAKFTNKRIRPGTLLANNAVHMALLRESEDRRQYKAPELLQAPATIKDENISSRHSSATRQSDIYSLGMILGEIFTGKSFLEADLETRRKLLNNSGLESQDIEILEGMLSLEPESRPENIIPLAETFERLSSQGTPLEEQIPSFKPGDRFQEYEIIDELEKTALSVSYQAKGKLGDEKVVLKFLKIRNPKDALEETRKVRDLFKQVRHTGYFAEWVEGSSISGGDGNSKIFYQVTGYIEGEDLRRIVWKEKALEREKIIPMALEIIKAVSVIHKVGWIHGDIKPANILLTTTDEIRIVDFGSCRRIEDRSPLISFSPGYTPPELMPDGDGNITGEWSQSGDVYSIACVITALLCGEKMDKKNGPIVDETLLEDGLPDWKDLLMRDMGNNPNDRCQSAMEMLVNYQNMLLKGPEKGTMLLDKKRLLKELKDLYESQAPGVDRPYLISLIKELEGIDPGDQEAINNFDLSSIGMEIEKYLLSASESSSLPLEKDASSKEETPINDPSGKPGDEGSEHPVDPVVSDVLAPDRLSLRLQARPGYSRNQEGWDDFEKAIWDAERIQVTLDQNEELGDVLKAAQEFRTKKRDELTQLATMGRSGKLFEIWVSRQKLGELDPNLMMQDAEGINFSVAAMRGEVDINWEIISRLYIDGIEKDPFTFDGIRTLMKKLASRPDLVDFRIATFSRVEIPRYGNAVDVCEYLLSEKPDDWEIVGDKIILKGGRFPDYLHDSCRREWDTLVGEVNSATQQYEQAMGEEKNGDSHLLKEEFLLAHYSYLRAKKDFSLLEGIDNKINSTRDKARSELQENFEKAIKEAEKLRDSIRKDRTNFSDAKSRVDQGLASLEEWKENTEEALADLKRQGGATQTSTQDFQKVVDEIENDLNRIDGILNSHAGAQWDDLDQQKKTEFEACDSSFEELKKRVNAEQALKEYFKEQLSDLEIELSKRMGVERAIKNATDVRKDEKIADPDRWQQIESILEPYKNDNRAKDLYQEAFIEHCIDQVKDAILHRNIPEAENWLKKLNAEVITASLNSENKQIEDANRQAENFKTVYIQAEKLKKSEEHGDQVKALQLYGYLSGQAEIDPSKIQTDPLHEYALNPYTYRAELAFNDLKQTLVNKLKIVKNAFDDQKDLFAPRDVYETWDELVSSLRKAGLVPNEYKRSACWVEAGWLVRQNASVARWDELGAYYQKNDAVEEGRLQAQVREVIQDANRKPPEQRVEFIRQKQGELNLVGNLDLIIALANAFADVDQYQEALKRLRITDDLKSEEAWKLSTARRRIEKEWEVYIRRTSAKNLDNSAQQSQGIDAQRYWRQALNVLLADAHPNQQEFLLDQDERIRSLAIDIFSRAGDGLENGIRTSLAAGGGQGYLEGILGLVNLNLLNTLGRKLELTAALSIPMPDKKINDLMNDPSIAQDFMGALGGFVNRIDSRNTAFSWNETESGLLLEMVEDLLEKNSHLKSLTTRDDFDLYLQQLNQIKRELERLVKRTDRHMYQFPWQDAVLKPMEINSTIWKDAVQARDFARRLDVTDTRILDGNVAGQAGLLGKTFEGRRFKGYLGEVKTITNNLSDLRICIDFLHSGEQFKSVVDLISWIEQPNPWSKPMSQDQRKNLNEIQWDLIRNQQARDHVQALIGQNGIAMAHSPGAMILDDVTRDRIYSTVKDWLNEKLRIDYAFNNKLETLQGWDGIKDDAQQRKENYISWRRMFDYATPLFDQAKSAYQLSKHWCDRPLPWTNYSDDLGKEFSWVLEFSECAIKQALFTNADQWLGRADQFTDKFNVVNQNGEKFESEQTANREMPQTYRGWLWQNAIDRLGRYRAVQADPDYPKETLSVKAREIQEAFDASFGQCETMLVDSGSHMTRIAGYGEFPPGDELSSQFKSNKPMFRTLMGRGREKGPSTPSQATIYWKYKKELEKIDGILKESLLEKIVRMLTGR